MHQNPDFMTRRKYVYIFILFLTACGGGDGGSNLGSQQNAAPEFIGLTEYVIDENTSTVTTIKATDPDGDTITYSLTGIDSSLLSINPSSGLLTFQSPPDYENPQDDNQDNIYSITVTASDGQLSASRGIIISVAFSGPTLDEPFHMLTMTGAGNTWTASISLEFGRMSIDLVTTHTVTVGGRTIPISAPYTRVALD